jgi:hypothetical protein
VLSGALIMSCGVAYRVGYCVHQQEPGRSAGDCRKADGCHVSGDANAHRQVSNAIKRYANTAADHHPFSTK